MSGGSTVQPPTSAPERRRLVGGLIGPLLFVLAYMVLKGLRLLPWHPVRAVLQVLGSMVGRIADAWSGIAADSARSTGSIVVEGLLELLVPRPKT